MTSRAKAGGDRAGSMAAKLKRLRRSRRVVIMTGELQHHPCPSREMSGRDQFSDIRGSAPETSVKFSDRPLGGDVVFGRRAGRAATPAASANFTEVSRSEEHTSELQSH